MSDPAGILARRTRFLRGNLVSFSVMAVSVLSVALPLLSAKWLPFVDYPEHLGAVGAIHGIRSAAYSPYFVTSFGDTQYLLFYFVADLLAYPFGVSMGTRLATVLGLALLPVAVAIYLRAHRRPAFLGALAACVAINVFVFWGFINFSMGIALAIFSLAALARLVRRPGPGALLVYCLLALATFYAHAQLYAWMMIASVVEAALLAPAVGWRRMRHAAGLAAVAVVPSILAIAVWMRASSVIGKGEAGMRSGALAAANSGARFAPILVTLRGFWNQSFAYYRDGAGQSVGILFLALSLGLMAARAIRGLHSTDERSAEDQRWARTLAPEGVIVSAFAAWLLAPHSYKLIAPINDRFLVVALALLPVLGPRRTLRSVPRNIVAALLVWAAVSTCGLHVTRFHTTDIEMGELDRALERTAPGNRLLGLIHDRQSRVVPYAIYTHAHQYYQGCVGGMASWGFVELPKSPIRYKQGAAPSPFPPRFEWTPEKFDWAIWGSQFDYFLVRTAPGAAAPPFFRPGAPGAPELVFNGPRWKLFAKRGLTVGTNRS